MGRGYTVAIETLGCKLNQYESDALATILEDRGYTVVNGITDADVYVINSCTVTNKADRKSRNAVYRARRKGGDGAVIILTGCFAEGKERTSATETAIDRSPPAPLEGVTYIVGNEKKNTIPDMIDASLRYSKTGVAPDLSPERSPIAPDIFGFVTPRQVFHTRTNLKLQDGCDNFCTFCIIPHVRGRAVSRAPQDVVTEARTAISEGTRELVLTGVNMSRYRYTQSNRDYRFVDLVREILALPYEFRLRISSLEPDHLDDRFIELFGDPKMAPHLHLCVQSGSDRVLKRMRRMYSIDQFRSVIDRLREIDPRFNVTTDIIVGFPGETESDYQQTLDLVETMRFGHVHTFPYSVRSGTPAARMDGQVRDRERIDRASRIREIAERTKRRYRESLVGTTEQLLIETVDPVADSQHTLRAKGLGEHYVPIVVNGPAEALQRNRCVSVQITGVSDRDRYPLIGVMNQEFHPKLHR